MRYQHIFLAIFILLVAGCVNKPFQPVPPLFETWERVGTAPDQVKEALLSCGYDNPYTGFATHLITVEKIAAGSQCMRRLGFRYLIGIPICEQPGNDRILACQ